ncbi:MAG: amidohydrolase, partial [Candidatus Bathyarchaeia archaeon]
YRILGTDLEKVDILIHGCAILPMNNKEVIADGAIVIKNGEIIFVGKRTAVGNVRAEKQINAKGKVALPGLVNSHTHVSMTLFRGLAEDKLLNVWLKDVIWPLEAKLTSDEIRAGALLGCLEMIKSGTTCFADMYFHEEVVAEAVKESGLRAVLAEGIIEAGNKALGEKMLENSVKFAEKFEGYAEGRVRVMLGPHAAYSCSPELLVKVRKKAEKLKIGIHTHLAESKEIFKDSEDNSCSEVEFLNRLDFFKGHFLAAHCINLSKRDMRILAEHHVNVAYVPVANMKLGLGAARIRELASLNINVALGTDGPASNNTLDILETMKVGALLQKLIYLNPEVLPAYDVLKMATINGAKALGLESSIGSLEKGKKADIILINLSKPHLKPLHDIYATIVYSARGSDVDTVIVDGKILMENRLVKTLKEEKVVENAEKHATDLLSRNVTQKLLEQKKRNNRLSLKD